MSLVVVHGARVVFPSPRPFRSGVGSASATSGRGLIQKPEKPDVPLSGWFHMAVVDQAMITPPQLREA